MKVQAIVTELDDPYRDEVENIWGELKAVFGLPALTGVAPPHLTYQWGDAYDAAVIDDLRRIAASTPRHTMQTHGLGVFRGDEVSLYLHVTPSPALRALHARLWRELAPLGSAVRGVYGPETWLPHVTLASGRINESEIDTAMRFLGRREYAWSLPVTNICFADGAAPGEWQRFDLAR